MQRNINKYKFLSLLGAGGMSKVYLAKDNKTGKEVAVKILNESLSFDPEYIKRFKREIEISKTLNHPNIVKIISYGKDKDSYYIVYEHIQGFTLDKYIKTKRLSVREIENIILQILEGLSYAHSKGIIHRDIKPSNIMISKDGKVKILDFGIARATTRSTITKTGMFMGSPDYVSPEQADGKKISATSDLYSFGILFFEMLSKRLPFSSDTPWGIVNKHINEAPPDISKIVKDIPPYLSHIVAKCLVKSPSGRFSSADEIISVLKGKSFASETIVRDFKSDEPQKDNKVAPPPKKKSSNTKKVWIAIGSVAAFFIIISIIVSVAGRVNSETVPNYRQEETAEESLASPSISLEVYEGPIYSKADDVCFYRIKAETTGDPEPDIVWNKDDSGGAWGKKKVQINLSQGESYTLSATATNSYGSATDSINLTWGCEQGNNEEENIDLFNYQLSSQDKVILTQPSVCFVTTYFWGYVLDPWDNVWSNAYFWAFVGTGFCVNPDTGHIVTAGHMVEIIASDFKYDLIYTYLMDTYGSQLNSWTEDDWSWAYKNIKVEGYDGGDYDTEVYLQFNTANGDIPDNPNNIDTFIRAELIDFSGWEQRDIALLRVQPQTERALSSVIVGDSSSVEVQDALTIIGYPWTSDNRQQNVLNPTITNGSISGKAMLTGTEVIQIQSSAREGNSGGPVLDQGGEVIGILTMDTDYTNNYLRPSNDVKEMLNRNGVTNTLGMVDEVFKQGLVNYRLKHYSKAIEHFNTILNLNQWHLQAQEYRFKSQEAIDKGEESQ